MWKTVKLPGKKLQNTTNAAKIPAKLTSILKIQTRVTFVGSQWHFLFTQVVILIFYQNKKYVAIYVLKNI
jgi:hypothetical protein